MRSIRMIMERAKASMERAMVPPKMVDLDARITASEQRMIQEENDRRVHEMLQHRPRSPTFSPAEMQALYQEMEKMRRQPARRLFDMLASTPDHFSDANVGIRLDIHEDVHKEFAALCTNNGPSKLANDMRLLRTIVEVSLTSSNRVCPNLWGALSFGNEVKSIMQVDKHEADMQWVLRLMGQRAHGSQEPVQLLEARLPYDGGDLELDEDNVRAAVMTARMLANQAKAERGSDGLSQAPSGSGSVTGRISGMQVQQNGDQYNIANSYGLDSIMRNAV